MDKSWQEAIAPWVRLSFRANGVEIAPEVQRAALKAQAAQKGWTFPQGNMMPQKEGFIDVWFRANKDGYFPSVPLVDLDNAVREVALAKGWEVSFDPPLQHCLVIALKNADGERIPIERQQAALAQLATQQGWSLESDIRSYQQQPEQPAAQPAKCD